jgi:hypothetical protein
VTATYVEALTRAYPTIKEIWLIGSRANDEASETSDWDYIAFADQKTLGALSDNPNFNDPTVDLFVVYDGNNFCKPWLGENREKKGSLTAWEWHRVNDTEARYKATKARDDDDFSSWIKTAKAKRVFP